MEIYAYYNTDTEEYPVFTGELFELYPEIDKSEVFFEVPHPYVRVYNSDSVAITEIPSYSQKIVEGTPVYDADSQIWLRSFSIVDLTEEEKNNALFAFMQKVRADRDAKLLESDAMVTIDRWETYADEVKEELRVYRQNLRDIPLQEGFPYDITYPEVPII